MAAWDVFVGSELGLLKGANLEAKTWCNINDVTDANKKFAIDRMCWADDKEKSAYLGLRNQTVCLYDVNNSGIVKSYQCEGGQGKFVGLAHVNGCPLTCTESGLLKAWTEQPTSVQFSKEIQTMEQNEESRNIIAVGGKQFDLELRDLTSPEATLFKAKNVKADWLGITQAVWVSNCKFVEGKIAVTTGHHQVRLYDPSSSARRPVIDFTWDEYPITSMDLVPNSMQVVVGNSKGSLAMLDYRKPNRFIRKYKGPAGSIKSIAIHKERPLVASCGVDRYLRVHHLVTRELVQNFYLKTSLNCLLFMTKKAGTSTGTSEKAEEPIDVDEKESDTESVDDVWESLPVVKKRKKGKSTNEETATDNDHGHSQSSNSKNSCVRGSQLSESETQSANVQQTGSIIKRTTIEKLAKQQKLKKLLRRKKVKT